MNETTNTSLTRSYMDDETVEPVEPVEPSSTAGRIREKVFSKVVEIIGLLRNFVMLLFGLLMDERVDRKVKIFAASVLAYIFAPIDFIPDFLGGMFGVADDFVLTAFAVNVLLNWVDPEIVRSHWRGKTDLLETVQKGIRNAEALVPDGILKKIHLWIGRKAPQPQVETAAVVPVETENPKPEKRRKKKRTSDN